MNKTSIFIGALALVAGQACAASAEATSDGRVAEVSNVHCAPPTKAAKMAKASRAENRCETSETRNGEFYGLVPGEVAGLAVVVGSLIAIGVVSTDNNAPTSP